MTNIIHEQKKSVKVAQKIAGHVSPSTTLIYEEPSVALPPPDHDSYADSGQPNMDFMAIADTLVPECEVRFGRKANIQIRVAKPPFEARVCHA